MSNVKLVKKFIKTNQERFLFGLTIILISIISFRAGEVKEREKQSSEMKVFINSQSPFNIEEKQAIALGKAIQRKGLAKEVEIQESSTDNEEECQYIGSKNSDKYHIPSCRWAEQIKPENKVCFKSPKEAEKMGYKPCSCNSK